MNSNTVVLPNNLCGLLLASHPQSADRSVVIIVSHSDQYSVGLQINQVLDPGAVDIESILESFPVYCDFNMPLYWGGPNRVNRVSVLHSRDWSSFGTVAINDQLAFTSDITVLTALNAGSGPRDYRVIMGHTKWPPGELAAELNYTQQDLDQCWLWSLANLGSVFSFTGSRQWQNVIAASGQQHIDQWFGAAV